MVEALELIPANERRSRALRSDHDHDHDVVAVDSNECVSRIFAKLATGGGGPSFRGLGFLHV